MPETPFIVGNTYKRSVIHDEYGGSRQSGIAASARAPYIFIFSGDSGHQHGYKDQWENPNVFSYSGEGQIEDMQFTKGNLAILDHKKNHKRIFLFIQTQKAYVKFEGELTLIEHDYFTGPDRNGNERLGIKFFFTRIGKHLPYPIEELTNFQTSEVEELIKRNIPSITEREGLVTSRIGQGAYRKSILYRWEFKCAVTGFTTKEILIASHIVPWKVSSNEERLDVSNGILLSPTYDALFDKRLISFENNGKIILADQIAKSNYKKIGVSGFEVIKDLSSENIAYLERHRSLLV